MEKFLYFIGIDISKATFNFTLIMARKEYLSYEEHQRFDSPPILTNMQRAIFIQLPDWAESYYKVLVTPTNQVGFLLQLGYFWIVCRFFDRLQFRREVTGFIQKTGRNIDPNAVDMLTYKQSTSYYRHQQEIGLNDSNVHFPQRVAQTALFIPECSYNQFSALTLPG